MDHTRGSLSLIEKKGPRVISSSRNSYNYQSGSKSFWMCEGEL